jgi:hypothetical protein
MVMQTAILASIRSALACVALSLAAAGCATTQQVKIGERNYCPFLGPNLCAKLTATATPGRLSGAAIAGSGEAVAGLRYIDPNAHWTQYRKVLIAPVTFWGGDDTKVSPADQQMLANYFHDALEGQLSKKFEVVQQAGPGVMRIEVALVDASTATPILRTISMIVPQARGLNTLKYLATGTYGFVGGAEAEVKIEDSVSDQVLAAAVDKRVGGGALSTAAQWQWGDAENAVKAWAEQMASRLSSWTSGTPPS